MIEDKRSGTQRYAFKWKGDNVLEVRDTITGGVSYLHGVQRGVEWKPVVESCADGIDCSDWQFKQCLRDFLGAGPQLERGRR